MKSKRIWGSAALVAFIVSGIAVATPTGAVATTRTVTQGQSIQAAIDASSNGDTVSVGPGTYYGNLTINGKYVSLVGDVSNPSSTIIRANNTSAAAVFISNVPWNSSVKTKVSGFTIADGNAPKGQAGGITIFNNSNPEITHNIITKNTAQGYGGGVEIFANSSPTIANNIISDNTATSGGGGIFVYSGSSPVIFGNSISGNRTFGAQITNGGSSGGGIYLENTSDPNLHSNPVVLNNTIDRNSAEFAGGGIMVRTGANVIIEGNHIGDNSAGYGGGIHLESTGSTAIVSTNVIERNSAIANATFPGTGVGGGIAIFDKTIATLTSNTIQSNSASNIGGGISSGESASTTLTGNLVKDNFVGSGDNSKQGGGLYAANSTLTATNNQFFHNSASVGGGIAMTGVPATLVNNSVVSNHAARAAGGAIYVASGSVALVNNLLTQNDGYQLFFQSNVGPSRLDNNLITTPSSTPSQEGSGLFFDYARRYTTAAQLNSVPNSHNNVVTDPRFVNSDAGDLSLTSTSGAINKATNVSIPPVSKDFRLAIRDANSLDIGAFEYVAVPVIPSHVYRFWSESKKGHFFTISADERNLLASTYNPAEWRYEGIAFDAFTSSVTGTVPLYRFYSALYQSHFYTANTTEADGLKTDAAMKLLWSYEGVAYYVYPLDTALQSKPVFRFWSPDNKHHFYTGSAAESAGIQSGYASNVWTYEGPNFRVPQ